MTEGGFLDRSEDFRVKISINYKDYRRFSYFDTFYRQHRHRRPLLFLLLLGAFSAVCFCLVGQRPGARLLAWILLAVAVLVPLAYFLQYAFSVRDSSKTLHLSPYRSREVYTLRFTDEAFYAAAGTSRPIRVPWQKLYHAYRTSNAIYIYATDRQAFIVPPQEASKTIWDFITTYTDASRHTDL